MQSQVQGQAGTEQYKSIDATASAKLIEESDVLLVVDAYDVLIFPAARRAAEV